MVPTFGDPLIKKQKNHKKKQGLPHFGRKKAHLLASQRRGPRHRQALAVAELDGQLPEASGSCCCHSQFPGRVHGGLNRIEGEHRIEWNRGNRQEIEQNRGNKGLNRTEGRGLNRAQGTERTKENGSFLVSPPQFGETDTYPAWFTGTPGPKVMTRVML